MHASTIFIGFAVLTAFRAIFGRFYLSFGRYRSYFDQLLLRACWLLLSFLFLISWFTRPATTLPEFNHSDTPILIFLLACAGLLEFTSLLLYRSRIEGEDLLVRTDGFGEVRLSRAEIRLLFSMRSGPQGISNDVWLLRKHGQGVMARPVILVSQVMLRTAGRHPFKYLVLAEVRSQKLAEKLTQELAGLMKSATLENEVQAQSMRRDAQELTAVEKEPTESALEQAPVGAGPGEEASADPGATDAVNTEPMDPAEQNAEAVTPGAGTSEEATHVVASADSPPPKEDA